MASSKRTFEPRTFKPNTFGSGVWRGIGVDVTTPLILVKRWLPLTYWVVPKTIKLPSDARAPLIPGLEYTISGIRLHYTISEIRLHYTIQEQ
jgi:hypothetical protein